MTAPASGATRGELPRLFWVSVAVALAIRAAHILAMANPQANPLFTRPIMDAAMHDQWARGILAGTWPGHEPFFRAPLYMYFLAGLYAVFGPEHRLAIQLVHGLVSALGAGLAALCAARVWGQRAGWAAGLLYAALWTSIFFAAELLLDSLAATLNLLLLWLLLRERGQPPPRAGGRWLLPIGLVWGLSAITRPNILIIAPIVVWFLRRVAGLRWRRAGWLWLAGGLLVPIIPVTAHNVLVGKDAVLIASQGGVNFYIGNNPQADGQTAVVPGTRPTWQGGYDDMRERAQRAAGRTLRPSEVDRYYVQEGLAFWAQQPLAAARLTLHKLRLLVAASERSNNLNVYFWRDRSWLLRWGFWVGWAPLLALAMIGLCGRNHWAQGRTLVLGEAGLYALSIVLFFVNDRFRLPLAVILAVPAGGGIDRLWAAIRARRWLDGRTSLIAAGLALLLSVVPDLGAITANKVDNDPFSWHTLGNTYLASGRTSEAEAAYRRSLAINRRFPQPYFKWIEDSVNTGLGTILQDQGRTSEAIAVYRDWVRSDPNSVAARVHLGDLLLKTGSIDDASAQFEIALRNEPDDFGAQLGQTWIFYHNGDYGAALRRFEMLARQRPDVQVQFGRGLCLMQLQRWQEAEQAFQEVVRRQPDYWQAWGNLAGLYERSGRMEDARHAYGQLLSLRPGDPRAQAWLIEHPR